MSAVNPYAPPKTDVADMQPREAAPPLWNPNAAASWSLVFSPIFGAWLHMKNWQAMGQTQQAQTSKTWLMASIAYLFIVAVLAGFLPDSTAIDALARFGGFGLLIAWYYGIGKSQNAFVLARYGRDYPRRGWFKPLLIAIAAFIGFVVMAMVIGFIAGMLSGGH